MGTIVKCGRCGSTDFDLREYESMMVLCADLALFGLRCPYCGTHVSAMCVIPGDVRSAVREAAFQVGAGMGGASRGEGAPNR